MSADRPPIAAWQALAIAGDSRLMPRVMGTEAATQYFLLELSLCWSYFMRSEAIFDPWAALSLSLSAGHSHLIGTVKNCLA